MKPTHDLWRELAGSVCDELLRSRESALVHLFDEEPNIQIAAINICDTFWNCSSSATFTDACRTLAATDPDDAVRIHAIEKYGKAFQSSHSPSASQFLADLICDKKNSEEVLQSAYWALRQVQLGLTEEDVVKRSICLAKSLVRKAQNATISEDQLKTTFLCGGRFSDTVWDFADQIDWEFVQQHASGENKAGSTSLKEN